MAHDATPARALPPQERPGSLSKDLLHLGLKVAAIVTVFVLAFIFVFGIIRYHEPGMVPTVEDGDLVVYYRYAPGGYQAQDAVVVEHEGQSQVRRVVAAAGDTVDITEDGLVVNGSLQQEPEIYQATPRYSDGVGFPLTVPPGQVFLLGDARDGATDSRIYGCVDADDLRGKVMMIIRGRGI
jgi:signal peptidase I